uniref:Uncharacterized protein n=1 Tax=Anguilla anguilla TaxID=7936 RepID=A0A0E9R9I6_ANGAN
MDASVSQYFKLPKISRTGLGKSERKRTHTGNILAPDGLL